MLPPDAVSGSCVIRDPAAFAALKGPWDSLAAHGPHPTQQHDWLSACASTFTADGGLHVIMVTRAGRLVAAAPLCVTPVGDFEPFGMPEMYEPSDLLYEDVDALGLLARSLARNGVPLLIRRLPADSPAIATVTRAYGLRALVHTRPAPAAPIVRLGPDWTGPEGGLSSRRRSDLRRARRKARAMGSLGLDLRAPTPDDVDETLEEAFAVEAQSWRAATGTAMCDDDLRGAFMRRYARRSAAEGRLRIAFLRIDGAAAAMQIAVEVHDRLWLIKMAYVDRFGRCSPGALLLLETLRQAADRGLRDCELLGSIEPWTGAWTTQSKPLVALRARPFGAEVLRDAGARLLRMAARRPVPERNA